LYYHISKYEAERIVRSGIARGLDAVIVNPTGMYGPAGSFYRGGELVSYVQKRRTVRYASGGACVVHVQDVIEGVMAALINGVKGHRYILGGENLTFQQMMQKAAATLRLKRTYLPIPGAVTSILAGVTASWSILRRQSLSPSYANYYCASRWSFYDSSKAHCTLGFKARPFETILEESIRFL
jgi:dihydroflavonol-4-reductase